MELATAPLPSQAPTTIPSEHHVNPWSDFLRRVLVSAEPAGAANPRAPAADTDAPPEHLSASESREDVVAR